MLFKVSCKRKEWGWYKWVEVEYIFLSHLVYSSSPGRPALATVIFPYLKHLTLRTLQYHHCHSTRALIYLRKNFPISWLKFFQAIIMVFWGWPHCRRHNQNRLLTPVHHSRARPGGLLEVSGLHSQYGSYTQESEGCFSGWWLRLPWSHLIIKYHWKQSLLTQFSCVIIYHLYFSSVLLNWTLRSAASLHWSPHSPSQSQQPPPPPPPPTPTAPTATPPAAGPGTSLTVWVTLTHYG